MYPLLAQYDSIPGPGDRASVSTARISLESWENVAFAWGIVGGSQGYYQGCRIHGRTELASVQERLTI